MRPIKFRAWDRGAETMLSTTFSPDTQWPTPNQEDFVLMQFTGLLDKNEKEIYEGDVVKTNDHEAGKIFWAKERGQWMVEWFEKEERTRVADELCDYWQHLTPEIIGNIYENPELIEKSNA